MQYYVRDIEKIQQIIQLCKELGVQYTIQPDYSAPQDIILLFLPNKKLYGSEGA